MQVPIPSPIPDMSTMIVPRSGYEFLECCKDVELQVVRVEGKSEDSYRLRVIDPSDQERFFQVIRTELSVTDAPLIVGHTADRRNWSVSGRAVHSYRVIMRPQFLDEFDREKQESLKLLQSLLNDETDNIVPEAATRLLRSEDVIGEVIRALRAAGESGIPLATIKTQLSGTPKDADLKAALEVCAMSRKQTRGRAAVFVLKPSYRTAGDEPA